jgi:hypothetical protein
VTGNQESKVPPEEGTFEMLHYALAEAQALQRVAAAIHSEAQVESPQQLQMQQDQHNMQLGINIKQPAQGAGTQPQHMMRRTVAQAPVVMPMMVDPNVATADAEMLHLQNTLKQLKETTMTAQLQLTQVTAEREARTKRDREVEDQKIERARLAKLARVRLEKEIEEKQRTLMTEQKQTVLMAATQPTVATGGTTPHLASGSSTALVEVATGPSTALVQAGEIMPADDGALCLRANSPPQNLPQQSLAAAVFSQRAAATSRLSVRRRGALRRHSTLLGRRRAV